MIDQGEALGVGRRQLGQGAAHPFEGQPDGPLVQGHPGQLDSRPGRRIVLDGRQAAGQDVARQGRAQPHVAGNSVQGGRSGKQVVKRWWAGRTVLAEYRTERSLGGLVGA